jgi:drug/metabolite transporter (DMT)-like permease
MVATNTWVITGVLFLGGFFFLYLAALSWADLSYVMPLTALSYLFAAVLAQLFLKEQISWIRWTGIMIIVLGIALVVLEPNGQKDVELSVSTSVEKVPGDNNKEG